MTLTAGGPAIARSIHVSGVVQGVGFRPYVFRLARAHALTGWVLNGADGVRVHVEGTEAAIHAFLADLAANAPPAARITAIDVESDEPLALPSFEIRDSVSASAPTTRISPDLPICDDCLRELRDPSDRRFRYPYINCTNCGPRFSIVRSLPYDRMRTTMAEWPLCSECAAEYGDPGNRRFHAQPVACHVCGQGYELVRLKPDTTNEVRLKPDATGAERHAGAIRDAARMLREGYIVAIKGIGGYHLACDAENEAAVTTLRERKFRKEKPFALMVRDLDAARRTVWLTDQAEQLLLSAPRPIVLCPARESLSGVAPENGDIGVMLPYAPLHYLLFDAGAPERLVMTSGNRSSEPIAYGDDDARARLGSIADAILAGGRPIARRVEDSVVRIASSGPMVLRHSRGYAPGVVAQLPAAFPILAVGADLKNTITLVVDGNAFMSQHVGDLEHYDALVAFRETIQDLVAMYGVDPAELVVAHDLHPQYASTLFAAGLRGKRLAPVQHHRAHVASVLAEHGEFETRVVGVAYDGTGYGDDGTIWGGEFFVGSLCEGFARVAHIRPALLPGGDAAAQLPAQAAAGFVADIESRYDLAAPPFNLPRRYQSALALVRSGVRVFVTTSAGRLFDTVAAITGFTRSITFEGQAAMWLEQLARTSSVSDAYPMSVDDGELDWRPAIDAAIEARAVGDPPADIARRFHAALARGTAAAVIDLAGRHAARSVALSGGVFQNALLLDEVSGLLSQHGLRVLTNVMAPPNDGGISLGQAAIAAIQPV